MAYFLGPNLENPDPAILRLDHLICRVPNIEELHIGLLDLGFSEAWPVGRFWPEGRTSGIALGGINLELIQPDSGAPTRAIANTLVFEPTSLECAERILSKLGVATHRFDKFESNPELLALRGFSGGELAEPQLICRNLLLDSPFSVPLFFCDYVPKLKALLSPENPRLNTPFGQVRQIHLVLPQPRMIGRLGDLGYLGKIEFLQSEKEFGEPRVTGIQLESGPLDLCGLDLGFQFV